MQQGVVGDVAGRELFPTQLDAVKHLGRDDDGVLREFFRVLGSDRFDGLRDQCPESWCDLFNEQISCLCCHGVFPPVWVAGSRNDGGQRPRHATTIGLVCAAWRGGESRARGISGRVKVGITGGIGSGESGRAHWIQRWGPAEMMGLTNFI